MFGLFEMNNEIAGSIAVVSIVIMACIVYYFLIRGGVFQEKKPDKVLWCEYDGALPYLHTDRFHQRRYHYRLNGTVKIIDYCLERKKYKTTTLKCRRKKWSIES